MKLTSFQKTNFVVNVKRQNTSEQLLLRQLPWSSYSLCCFPGAAPPSAITSEHLLLEQLVLLLEGLQLALNPEQLIRLLLSSAINQSIS